MTSSHSLNDDDRCTSLLKVSALLEPLLHSLGERGQQLDHLVATLGHAFLHLGTLTSSVTGVLVFDLVRARHGASLEPVLESSQTTVLKSNRARATE